MIELTKDVAVLMVQCGLVGFALGNLFWCVYLYRESNRESERIRKEIEETLSRFEAEKPELEARLEALKAQSSDDSSDDDSPWWEQVPESTKARIRR